MFADRWSTLWKITLAALLALILTRFWVVGQAKVLFNTQSSDGDESAYLELGLNLQNDGVLSDGTRPPLYPAVLALVAGHTWAYFTWAKLITLAMGAATVLVVFLIGGRLFNWETGLLAAFLLAANREFHLRAATVYADTLLVLLFVAAWYALIKSFSRSGFRYWAGILVGLAYLTKGSATLLLAAWGLTALAVYRQHIWPQIPRLLVVPLMFLLTALPLLVFNVQNFGSPFYNFATTHVMWMDHWAESQVADPADLPTAVTYLQTHSAADVASGLQEGIHDLNPQLLLTLIPSRTLEPPWRALLVITVLAAGGWLLLFQRDAVSRAGRTYRVTLLLSLFFFGLFYLFSAWYARVLIESRFLIPLLGPAYILLAAAVVGTARLLRMWLLSLAKSGRSVRIVRWLFGTAVALLVVWAVGWLIQTTRIDWWSMTVNPFESDRSANAQPEALLRWLVHDKPDGPTRVVFGPSKSLPLWKFPARFGFAIIPVGVDTWPKMEAFLAETRPDYLIIDSDTARRRRTALSRFFGYTDGGIEIKQMPVDWPLAYLHNGPPLTWAIFTPFARPQVPVVASFGHQFELQGYDATLAAPARRLRVTLYWQASAPPKDDYTVFLHLTAPDGFVKAQQDRQPFDRLWPTGRWQVGQLFADRFEIPLDDSVPPGNYLLLTGLYTPANGQRLPLTAGPPAPQPDAALLGPVTIPHFGP